MNILYRCIHFYCFYCSYCCRRRRHLECDSSFFQRWQLKMKSSEMWLRAVWETCCQRFKDSCCLYIRGRTGRGTLLSWLCREQTSSEDWYAINNVHVATPQRIAIVYIYIYIYIYIAFFLTIIQNSRIGPWQCLQLQGKDIDDGFRPAILVIGRLSGLVVRDPGYRSRGPVSILGATRLSEK
jgi:hypothetical protein